jgi:ParB family chromosome partitioning protein
MPSYIWSLRIHKPSECPVLASESVVSDSCLPHSDVVESPKTTTPLGLERNMKVPITDIVIKERVRKEIGDIAPLMDSMQKHGQLNPISITRDNELVAGHRRLLSATELNWSYIDALIINYDSEIEKLQLELEENVHRKDFAPEELLAGYRRLEKLLRPSFPRRIATFFATLFNTLFRRKNRKQKSQTPRPMLGTTADITEPDVAMESKKHKAENPDAPEIGQYGV